MEREREKGKWWQNEKGGGEREEGSERETGWRESGWTSVLFMPLREQGLSLCPVCLFNADRGWDRGAREGGLCWRGEVTECAHWKETMSALILLWHNKTIRGGLFTKLDYSAPVHSPIWRVISWDGSVRASHNTTGCLTTLLWQEILFTEGSTLKLSFIHWIILHFLWRLLEATHPVIAVLTQVVASNEEGHQLPVILKIHRLLPLKGWRKYQTERVSLWSQNDKMLVQYHILNSQSRSSWYQSGVGPALGFLCIILEIFTKWVPKMPKHSTKYMKMNHWNLISDQRNVGTHDILAPDTAMLKPVCLFHCPFDTPLIFGLNFFRISDVKKLGNYCTRDQTRAVLQSNSAI